MYKIVYNNNMLFPLNKKNKKKLIKNKYLNRRSSLSSLVNSMADGVIAVNQKGHIQIYNAAALNILDLNNLRLGTALSNVFKPIDKNNQRVNIDEIVKKNKVPITNRDLRIQYDDGSIINLYLSIAPVHLGYGRLAGREHVLLLRDITREKSLEEERDEFISVVSHELRTPIAITEGNISNAEFMVKRTDDIEKIKKALHDAHSQVLFLADLINDLSTLSRAERGVLEVEVEPIVISELLDDLFRSYQPQAKAKNLDLFVNINAKDDLILKSSKLYVREILQNFITNSLKYTLQGSITINVKAMPKGVEFAVIDTGIGINKADQERVFDKFFRAEDFQTRQSSGTGLGLYVTMKLSRLIHADIHLDSLLGKGSTFTIFIPNLD